MGRNAAWLGIMTVASVLIVAGLFWPGTPQAPTGHRILPVAATPEGGDIELPISSSGRPFRLGDQGASHWWIYFGYTSCPDACPVSLAWVSGALSRLPDELQGQVAGLFVSVDPERDDAARLRAYADHFHPNIVAATGSRAQIEELAQRYGVFFQRTEIESALGYVIDHTSATYLVGRAGEVLEVHPHGTSSTELLAVLQSHLATQ